MGDLKANQKFITKTADSFKRYFSLDRQTPTKLAKDMRRLVVEGSEAELLRVDGFINRLREEGNNDEVELAKVALLLQVSAFRNMIANSQQVPDDDMVRAFIVAALDETGLTRKEVLRLGQALLYATGRVDSFESSDDLRDFVANHKTHFVVPYNLYEDRMKAVSEKIDLSLEKPFSNLEEQTLEELTELAKAGVPQAMFFYGSYLLEQEADINKKEGMKYIADAAENGVPKAELKLADLAVKSGKYSEAYDMYTGIPARAMDSVGIENLDKIEAQKKANKATIILSFVLVFMFAALLAFSYGRVSKSRFVVGCVMAVPVLAAPIVGLCHYKKKPFDSAFGIPCLQLILISAYNFIFYLI